MSKHIAYALLLTFTSGVVGWSIRSAQDKPHPTLVGVATAAIIASIALVSGWISE